MSLVTCCWFGEMPSECRWHLRPTRHGYAHDMMVAVLTARRSSEMLAVVGRVRGWVSDRPDVRGVAIVGSWARREATMDSDLDIVLLVTDAGPYVGDEGWVEQAVGELAGVVRTKRWGPSRSDV